MDAREGVASEVQAILADASERVPDRNGPLSVESRSLADALDEAAASGRRPVIAEIKPTSPTTDGRRDADPVELATAMVDGGAAALSVLTEPDHFGGSPEALTRVREAVDVPVLRKDFILEPAQLDTVPADAVLVIARFVDDLDALVGAATDRGFDVLVETHTASEFTTAVEAGATLVGINNRDLAALAVDLGTVESVLSAVTVPPEVTVVAESGIASPADAERMLDAGADGLLVGSAIMNGVPDSGPETAQTNTERLTQP